MSYRLIASVALVAFAIHACALRCAAPLRSAPLRTASPMMNSMDNLEKEGTLSMVGGAMCYRLDEITSEKASEPFRNVVRSKYKAGTWYACTEPADDVELTCFMVSASHKPPRPSLHKHLP